MKNLADIQTRLKLALIEWFKKQSAEIYKDYYLYYLPSSAEHEGGLIICENAPPNKEYQLAWNEKINKGATIDQNFNYLQRIIRTLPILSY
jgi:hypothetical protein